MLPVLVVQVPDKADEDKLGEIVGVIEDEWPDLGPEAIVFVPARRGIAQDQTSRSFLSCRASGAGRRRYHSSSQTL